MKKLLSILLATLVVVSLAVSASAAFDRSYTAPKGTPNLDGTVDAIWDNAEWTNVDKPFDGSTDTDSTLKVKLLWDDEHLYFLAEVYDKDINVENDIVEIYWDLNNDKDTSYGDDDMQTRFKVANGEVVQDSGANCQNDAECVSVSLGGDKYLLEGALTWTQAVKEGQNTGLEFMYNEGDSTSDFTEAYRWNVDTANGDGAPYADTSAFGTLTLGAAPVVETEAPVVETVAETTATETVAAPKTFDAGIIAAVLAVVSGAGYMISKKSK